MFSVYFDKYQRFVETRCLHLQAVLKTTERSLVNTFQNFDGTFYTHLGFEAITAVVMKSSIFWDITPCSLLKVNRRFGGIYHLHRIR
jgi:hypothetical protein